MKIKRLHLENFKSYKDETINFEEGINCILGNNGAGKSTIIEAIGYAMFNNLYLSPKTKYIRYGEKKAKIELDYIANDGVMYSITRTIGGGDNVKILNNNTNEIIEDVSNVYPYVAKTLGLKQDRKLTNLFEEIIAVPQGEFVSLFLLKDSERKDKFSDLFNLKIYEDIYDKVAPIISKNKDNIHNLQTEIEGYKGETKDIEEVKEEARNLEQTIKTLTIENSENLIKQQELNDLILKEQELKDAIDKIKEDNIELEKNKAKKETEKESLSSKQNEIIAAEKIIKDNQLKYDRYQKLNEDIQKEETRIEAFNSDSQTCIEKKGKLSSLQQLDKKSLEIINAQEFKIEALRIELNKINEEKNSKLKEKQTKEKDSEDIEQKIEESNNKINDINSEIEEINRKNNEYKLEYKEVEKYKNLYLDDLLKIKNNLNEEKSKKSELEKKIVEVSEKVIHQRFVVENINKNMEDLSNGRCPILNKECLTISSNGSEVLIKTLAEETGKLNELNREEELLKEDQKQYNDLNERVIVNSQEIANAEEYNNIIKNIKESIKNDFNFQNIDTLKINECFEKIECMVSEKQEELSKEQAEKEKHIRTQNDIKEAINSIDNKLVEIGIKITTTTSSIKDAEVLKSSSNESVKNNAEIKANLNRELSELAIKIEENRNASAQKAIYKKEQENLKNAYDLYIQNKPIFDSKEQNENALKDCINKLKDIVNKLEENTKQLSEKSIEFDDEKFETNKKSLVEITSKINHNENTLKESKERYEKVSEKITYKNGLISMIQEKEKLISKYNKVEKYLDNARNILRNLPIELSRRYRESISSMATNYYRKISKENVSIEIDDKYNVIVREMSNKDNKKDMSQLSGGEQMSLAISIRISMLKYFAGIDMYFLDEPTVNLDKGRRYEIAEVIKNYSNELKQLFVISHDDTFEAITTNILKLEKNNNESELSIE